MAWLSAATCALLLQEPATFDLRLDESPAGATVIDLESEGTVTRTIERPTGPEVEKSKLRVSRRLLDEVTAAEPNRRMTRRVVRWREDLGDAIEDPPIVGLDFLLTEEGGDLEVTQPDGHLFLPHEWDRLTIQMQSPALHVALPEAAAIGVAFPVEDPAFLHLLIGLEGTVESSAIEFTLTGVDPEKRLALLRGHATARAKLTEPAEVTADWSSDFELVVDLAARRVANVKGRATMAATMSVQGVATALETSLRFRAKVEGGAAAKEAAAEKTKPRDRTFRLAAAGVSVTLPSCFFLAVRGPDVQLQTIPPEGLLAVLLRAYPLRGGKLEDAMAAAFAVALQENPGMTEPKAVMSSLGLGKGVSLEKDGKAVDVELYPLGKDSVLRLQVIGTPAVRERYAKDLVRIRATLKALEQ